MGSLRGSLVTETLGFDGGRGVTAYLPPGPAESVVLAADGAWHTERLAGALEGASDGPSTMIVGVHGPPDDDARLQEYVASSGGDRFAAFERFVLEDVRSWALSILVEEPPVERTAVWGASLGGELALALGLGHPDLFGVVLCASPGGGFTPDSGPLAHVVPRTYLVGGRQEPWFLASAARWADALRATGADVVFEAREGEHGGRFWYDELPRMVAWAFDR